MRDLSPTVFRGEYSGHLRDDEGHLRPYFFAERLNQAKLYAGRGTDPIACVIQGSTILDLTALDFRNETHNLLVKKLTEMFDDWTCRYSGEPRDPWSYLESGDLYDYEGTGSGERWRAAINLVLDDLGFDAVRIMDCTDGTGGQPSPVWVTCKRELIREATVGEQLSARLLIDPWVTTRQWLERDHSDILSRISRLSIVDESYRLDHVHTVVPPENFKKMSFKGGLAKVYRALPSSADIRPGDWISLSESYAGQHDRSSEAFAFEIKSLDRVTPSDVYWAGTDEQEFFYLPAAWRKECTGAEDYLSKLTSEQIRMLCDGEEATLTRFKDEVQAIKDQCLLGFDEGSCGEYHGPRHWNRVCKHAHSVSRSAGIDPLVSHIFSWVHDSQREDDGQDLNHGSRAAAFVRANRAGLFGFMSDQQLELLANACDLHSHGVTEGDIIEQSCWDSDRLDLWRVDIEPEPAYMCTPYGKDHNIIYEAGNLVVQEEGAFESETFRKLLEKHV